jgi:hypothetical protein
MNGIEKKFRAKNSYSIDIAEYDDNARYLIGWPGYRTSRNKSGLGYVETQAELAHMQGLMIRWLFTGKFITHNPFFLLMITLFGIFVGIFPLVMLLAEIFLSDNTVILYLLPALLPYMAVGIGLFINVVISVLNPNAKSITGD